MQLDAISVGQYGSVLVTAGQSAPAGNYIGFLAVTDVNITTFKGELTNSSGAAITTLTSYTFPAGIYIPVPFLNLTVNTGTLIAVKSNISTN